MTIDILPHEDGVKLQQRSEELRREYSNKLYVRTDRLFAGLMIIQFIAAIFAAVLISPRTWVGDDSYIHFHVYAAVGIGFCLMLLPVLLAIYMPGAALTRYVIAVAQVLFSALFIHLSGGRIETHFHVFGSLAFIAFYRDWRVLIPATAVVAIDHLYRGIFWPESVFGVIASAPWRAIEHAGWVIFEDIFLIYSCVVADRDSRVLADRQARLESINTLIEYQIQERTCELEAQAKCLAKEMDDRKTLESQLIHAQKLESIGQLAAGIAHEINTPSQYVGDNTRFLQTEFASLIRVLDKYAENLEPDDAPKSWQERAAELRALLDEVDYDFLREEIPQAIEQSLEGIDRISQIVVAMKEFSHPGSTEMEPVNINMAIQSTVTVCRNRWKYAADLKMDLAEDLPMVPCLLAEFNQVILNLIVNAADALCEQNGGDASMGKITVSTRLVGSEVEIRVADNGPGIPVSVQNKIFDPFYTTKEVGKGTGQGLAISRNVIVQKHGGTLTCESEPEKGAVFIVRIPVISPDQEWERHEQHRAA